MKSLTQRLEEIKTTKMFQAMSKDARNSFDELIDHGYARTGYSAKRCKEIWTTDVATLLRRHDIPCVIGNDAPRGGACGEYVAINMKVARPKSELKHTYDHMIAGKRNFMAQFEIDNARNKDIADFRKNPANVKIYSEEDSTRIYYSEYGADYVARHDHDWFVANALPIAINIFKEHGVEVTLDELLHNYDAWYRDFKSQIITKSGWKIYSACGCNHLGFSAYKVKEGDFSYTC